MQEKEQYICPECEAVALHIDDAFCQIQSSNDPNVKWVLLYDDEED